MAQAPARCLNHPERTAVARCKQCHKPLCQKCVMKMPGGIFCSQECYDKMGQFQERVKKLDEAPKAGFSFGKLARWAIIAAIILGIVYFVFIEGGVRTLDDLVGLIRR